MELKIKGNKGTRSEGLGTSLGNFWNRRYKFFLAFFLALVLGAGGFFWYESLYKSAWSEQERESYRITKDRGINFKEKDFSEALDIIEKRKSLYMQNLPDSRDIFKTY
ncbi:MAG: hypothetical protein ACD_15C00180G0004 [uncultured bacterium]|nr:MAG: hypothetical protein ACD_15C00180G0004 [uncultured bacterium]KKT88211.1 MAG: hypothetical protein UW87_C0016G0003 [Candidatus Moranbacteria bacterium GW2011_GWC2_45_10]KKT94341.1 MAG: hypothetical protein UW95_C0016G0014 [Parcubacteria group bacterium GW2011_GWC1_45_14]HAV11111.1 hypothetical protein [Candidatus Moranbacteria bacterium]